MSNKTSSQRSSSSSSNDFKPDGRRIHIAGRSISPFYLLMVLVIVAGFIWSIWWFLHNFERVSRTDYTLNPQAQYNPYYAAELLINSQRGDEVATTLLDSDLKALIEDLPELESSQYSGAGPRPTLIINSIGTKLTPARFDVLKSWIEQGGHLITFTAQSADNEDMQAALKRLDTLQAQKASPETIANDERLSELMAVLDSGNAFLNQLGIFLVEPDDTSFDGVDIEVSGEIEAEIDRLLDDIETEQNQQQALEQAKSTQAFVSLTIEELLRAQPLSLLALGDGQDQLRMVEVDHYGSALESTLFEALHPDSEATYQGSAPKDKQTQAVLIRRYINTSLTALKQAAPNFKSNESKNAQIKDENVANNEADDEDSDILKRLPELLTAMLALEDDKLVDLFYPADNIYLDTTFGQGRLSVISDSEAFSNPNPNLEMLDIAEAGMPEGPEGIERAEQEQVNTTDALPVSALHELLDSGYVLSLLSADNAAWLIDLTADSSEVWILPNTDIDPLPLMLWKQARPALLGLGLLAVLWLWSLYNRFGKMALLPTSQSRDIMRYFRQVGRFGWHQDNAQKLTRATKDKVRLLINEHLNDTAQPNTGNSSSNPISIEALHHLLLARLQAKKERLTLPLLASNADIVDINDTRALSQDNDNNLLLTNEDFIKAAITPARLRAALGQQSTQAFAFTQATQTLWTIQWLLE
ncbi:hypothetical protein [Psychrobacter jeotgali]|uniref:hypothetical protein n=1 Tax=Psychrobacter jeotgali TaxID=179010 RepID=UPI00191A5E06|nr:hypothetical protein [Psychrobacter jeotgali]